MLFIGKKIAHIQVQKTVIDENDENPEINSVLDLEKVTARTLTSWNSTFQITYFLNWIFIYNFFPVVQLSFPGSTKLPIIFTKILLEKLSF